MSTLKAIMLAMHLTGSDPYVQELDRIIEDRNRWQQREQQWQQQWEQKPIQDPSQGSLERWHMEQSDYLNRRPLNPWYPGR